MNLKNAKKLEYVLNNSIFLSDDENDFLAGIYAKTYDEMSLTNQEQNKLDLIFKSLEKDNK